MHCTQKKGLGKTQPFFVDRAVDQLVSIQLVALRRGRKSLVASPGCATGYQTLIKIALQFKKSQPTLLKDLLFSDLLALLAAPGLAKPFARLTILAGWRS